MTRWPERNDVFPQDYRLFVKSTMRSAADVKVEPGYAIIEPGGAEHMRSKMFINIEGRVLCVEWDLSPVAIELKDPARSVRIERPSK